MAAKRASAKTKAKKTARRAGRKARAKKVANRVAVKARAALKKAAPRPIEPPRKAAEIPDETLIVDIIEEPVPGVVVVTEFEAVRTSRPETPAQRPEGGEGSGAAEREEEED
jgi:sRNA-binding protein